MLFRSPIEYAADFITTCERRDANSKECDWYYIFCIFHNDEVGYEMNAANLNIPPDNG